MSLLEGSLTIVLKWLSLRSLVKMDLLEMGKCTWTVGE